MFEKLSLAKEWMVGKKKYVAMAAASIVALNEYLNGTLDLGGMFKAFLVAFGAA